MKPAAVFPIRSIAIRTIAALFGAGSTGAGLRPASAAELRPETVRAWDDYVQVMNAQMKARLAGGRFLWMDEQPRRSRDVRSGTILVTPMGAHSPAGVPNGLIHHWIGAAFLPAATMEDVLSVVRNYSRYKEFYHPVVVDSRPLGANGEHDRFSMILLNRMLFSKIAMDSDYEGKYFDLDDRRWYNVAHSPRVQEVENYGEASE